MRLQPPSTQSLKQLVKQAAMYPRMALWIGLAAILVLGGIASSKTYASLFNTPGSLSSQDWASIQALIATQNGYLKAGAPDVQDYFGWSVAADGNTVVVGTIFEYGNGSDPGDNSVINAGAAYVFVRENGTWTQQAYLKASNVGESDVFGWSVDIDGDTIVVGARGEASNGTSPADNSMPAAGAAYVFVRANGTWTQQAYLKASNADSIDVFGASVAIDGDTIVVTAPYEDGNGSAPSDNSAEDAGAAYIFVRNGTTWTQQAYLKASNADAGDAFGWSADISGDLVAIGAYNEDGNGAVPTDNSATNAGALYVFRRAGTTWNQEAYLKGLNTEARDLFGSQLALQANRIVVGAPLEDSNGTVPTDNSSLNSGAVYIFEYDGTLWSQTAYLKPTIVGIADEFGSAVALDGDTLVVGTPLEDSTQSAPDNNALSNSGAVYVFVRDGTTWQQEVFIKAIPAGATDQFGYDVAITGDLVVGSARYEDSNGTSPTDNSLTDSGAVYTFEIGPEPPTATPTLPPVTPTLITPTTIVTPTATVTDTTVTPTATVTDTTVTPTSITPTATVTDTTVTPTSITPTATVTDTTVTPTSITPTATVTDTTVTPTPTLTETIITPTVTETTVTPTSITPTVTETTVTPTIEPAEFRVYLPMLRKPATVPEDRGGTTWVQQLLMRFSFN